MGLQFQYEKAEDIPSQLADHYAEKDVNGSKVFVLNVEGVKPQAEFDTFAEALRRREKETSDKLVTARSEIDELKEKIAKLEKGGNDPDDGGDNPRLHDLERQMAAMKESQQRLERERDEARAEAKNVTIRDAISKSAVASGVIPSAVDVLVTQTMQLFEISEAGDVVTKADTPGVSPNLNADDYLAAFKQDPKNSFYWPASQGGGASGGNGSDNLGANPWDDKTLNLTEQGRILKTDRERAKRLAAAAGKPLIP